MKKLVAIDPRSLALFRIALGLVLLADLAVRASDLRAMYTDQGMFPRTLVASLFNTVWNWSFHFASGTAWFQGTLMLLAAILAIAFIVGYQTRIATVGSWLLLLSIHHRAPAVLSGADFLLRLLLFWSMFLPLERLWSIDQRRGKQPASTAPIVSVATAAILLQMGLMYFFSAISKTNEHWLRGEALAGMLSHDFFASQLGAQMLGYPALLRLLTWASFALEWIGPILLFLPWRTWVVRAWVIAALMLMHIGIELLMEVGLFSYVSMAGLLLFVPPQLWSRKPVAEEKPVTGWGVPQAVCGVALGYCLLASIGNARAQPSTSPMPGEWKPFVIGLGLDQRWGMFGAIPTNDGWYVARAQLANGSEVDLLREGALVDWRRPPFPAGLYPNSRWQKLFREMAYFDELGYQAYRAPAADFLRRRWDVRHGVDKRVLEFEFVYCNQGPTNAVRQPLVQLEFTD